MNIATNQKPIEKIKGFNGLYSRGNTNTTPLDHLTTCVNCSFPGNDQISVRERFTIQNELPGREILSFFIYTTSIGAGLLTLNANGDFWDETHAVLLHNIPNAEDFCALNAFGRTYISFKRHGQAMPGEWTYFFDGVTFRRISYPAYTFPIVLSTGPAGQVDTGTHFVGISFITDTGALSPVIQVAGITVDGTQTIKGNLPIGGAGVVGRQILISKANEEELFFGPAINNNVDVDFEYNDFDTSLIVSADYLKDTLEVVPSCAAIKLYKGRLVLIGQRESPNEILISRSLEPESFDIINGTLHLPFNYGLNVASGGLIIRDVLYITKPDGTYSTQDNGDEPGTWPVQVTDSGLGAYDNGISLFASDTSAQDVLDSSLLVHKRGLVFFNGAFADIPLTWKIESIWQKMHQDSFYKICIAHDYWAKRVYISVPLTLSGSDVFTGEELVPGDNCDVILMMDYSHSLSPQTVKWSVWLIIEHANFKKISMEDFTLDYGSPMKIYQLAVCNGSQTIWKIIANRPNEIQEDDITLAGEKEPIFQIAIIPPVIPNGITTFTMLNLEVGGDNFLSLRLYSKNKKFFKDLKGFDLGFYSLQNNNFELQRLINFQDEGMQVKLYGNGFNLTRLDIYGTVMFAMRPALLEKF